MLLEALQDRSALAERLGVTLPEDWPGPDFGEIIPYLIEHLEANPSLIEWNANLIIHTLDRTVIGDIGFKGEPDGTGTIEIGYSIITAYRRQGYAFEAAQALVRWAFAQPGVRRVAAECLPDNPGSIRVLEKLGMKRVEWFEGVLRWELLKSPQRTQSSTEEGSKNLTTDEHR
jgi:ribosomal-protein-alanine N-acetyltransferase